MNKKDRKYLAELTNQICLGLIKDEEIVDELIKIASLREDPFTHLYCTSDEFEELYYEYISQLWDNKYDY